MNTTTYLRKRIELITADIEVGAIYEDRVQKLLL